MPTAVLKTNRVLRGVENVDEGGVHDADEF
jgi:hypothetical protein